MLETGIPNLDLILGGGLTEGDILLLAGLAGTGKTTLCLQTGFHLAARGRSVLYVSTLSEPPGRILRHLRGFAFFDESLVGNRLTLLNAQPLIAQGLDRLLDALVRAVKEHDAALLIIDGLMTLHELYPQAPELRSFIYQLGATLVTLDTTVFLTTSGRQDPDNPRFPEYTIADGVLELQQQSVGTRAMRTIRVTKLRGRSPLLGQHTLHIDHNGLTVFPRLESFFAAEDVEPQTRRVPFGLPELDALMHGGPFAESTTLLAGALGTGKTLVCLQFLYEGTRRGERALSVGTRETPRQLLAKARRFGMDLEAPLADGRLLFLHLPAVDLTADEFVSNVMAAVDRLAPQRLTFDDVGDLEQAVGRQRAWDGYMAAIAWMMRARHITALTAKEVRQVVGPELDFSDTPLAMLADNLLLLRWVEFRSQMYRILSVLKMSDSAHDRTIRQYDITAQGLKVLEPLETAEGILTGIARLPSERRVKRQAGPRTGER